MNLLKLNYVLNEEEFRRGSERERERRKGDRTTLDGDSSIVSSSLLPVTIK